MMCIDNSYKSKENADSDLIGLGWGLRVYISNKLPGDTGAALWNLISLITLVFTASTSTYAN